MKVVVVVFVVVAGAATIIFLFIYHITEHPVPEQGSN